MKEINAVLKGFEGEKGIRANLPGVKLRYPCTLHKDGFDPIVVNNEDEENQARLDGYDSLTASAMANNYMTNWIWDLEDLSPKQLAVFAKDEYGVNLMVEAGQSELFMAVCELARHAPQNRNRLVLMGHTIKLNYDATIAEIKRMIANPDGEGLESETISFEIEV